MANVRITKEEAKDPFKLPHVCMKCGVPPVIAKPTWFWRKKPEEKVPPDQGGLVAILMILGLDAIVNLFMNSGYEKVVLYTPLCKSCDEEFTADELARLEDLGQIPSPCRVFVMRSPWHWKQNATNYEPQR